MRNTLFKSALTVFLAIILSACASKPLPPEVEYSYVGIPSIYLKNCVVEAKEGMTFQDLILEQREALKICNARIDKIRELNGERMGENDISENNEALD